jgi:hypothetical protein
LFGALDCAAAEIERTANADRDNSRENESDRCFLIEDSSARTGFKPGDKRNRNPHASSRSTSELTVEDLTV